MMPCVILRPVGLAVLAVTCVGCLTRKETITVARDGAVTIAIQYKGLPEDLNTLDPLPSAASGWDVQQTVKMENEKETHVLSSSRRFAPGEALPESYGAEDDPDADLYLTFPTSVQIDRTRDGQTFRFRRTYPPRRWAYVEYWRDQCFNDDVKKLSDKPVEKLTDEERNKVVQAFACFEAFKQIEFAGIALHESHPDAAVEAGLLARQALLDVYVEQHDHFADLSELCAGLGEDERGDCLTLQAERILGEGYDAFAASLERDSGFTPRDVKRFHQAYERAERYHKITDQQGGHHFKILVTLPGEPLAHNADQVDFDEDDGTTTFQWEFEGKAFRDRPMELVALSSAAAG